MLRFLKNCFTVVFTILFYIGTMAIGAAIAFVIPQDDLEEANHIEEVVLDSPVQLSDMVAGTEVAFTGTLQGNPTLSDEVYSYLPPVTAYELVAYQADEFYINHRNNSETISWYPARQIAPPLNVEFGGRTASLTFGYTVNQNFDYFSSADGKFTGSLHEFIQPYPVELSTVKVETSKYNGQELPERSVRIQGFRNGDLVTVVGTFNGSAVTARRLHGGDSASLVNMLRSEAGTTRLTGLAVMGGSTLVGAVLLVVRLFKGLRGKRETV